MIGFSEINQPQNDNPVIKMVGIGGGGGNAINRMAQVLGTNSVEIIVPNTDLQDLKKIQASHLLQLDGICTRDLGAGVKPEIGKEAALENLDLIQKYISGADLVFIVTAMGGDFGTGASPVIAQIAKESGALTIGIVTMPFSFEGIDRRKIAESGVELIEHFVDTLIVLGNDSLLEMGEQPTSQVDSFVLADDMIRQAVQSISGLTTNEGFVNLDFADVRTIMQDGGKAVMGVGIASGDNRAIVAAEKAVHSPLLGDCKITGSQGIIVNMVGGSTTSMHEINEAACFFQEQANDDATIIWAASINPELEDQIKITLIATGIRNNDLQGIPVVSMVENKDQTVRLKNFIDAEYNKLSPQGKSQFVLKVSQMMKNNTWDSVDS
ncbi:MAG: cell division protein FtsZ [SAR324 cluster bacterium]|nr:cell division protein FtsZ [SAR324 cluster bacterium]